MTKPVTMVREDTPFADALTVSAEKHVKRFPVVDVARTARRHRRPHGALAGLSRRRGASGS
jgi:CBS domain-containing protein